MIKALKIEIQMHLNHQLKDSNNIKGHGVEAQDTTEAIEAEAHLGATTEAEEVSRDQINKQVQKEPWKVTNLIQMCILNTAKNMKKVKVSKLSI